MMKANMCLLFSICYSHWAKHSCNLPNYHEKLVLLFASFLQMKTLRLKKSNNCSKLYSSLIFLIQAV